MAQKQASLCTLGITLSKSLLLGGIGFFLLQDGEDGGKKKTKNKKQKAMLPGWVLRNRSVDFHGGNVPIF